MLRCQKWRIHYLMPIHPATSPAPFSLTNSFRFAIISKVFAVVQLSDLLPHLRTLLSKAVLRVLTYASPMLLVFRRTIHAAITNEDQQRNRNQQLALHSHAPIVSVGDFGRFRIRANRNCHSEGSFFSTRPNGFRIHDCT